MKRLALVLSAALIVAVPLMMATPTQSYAAVKRSAKPPKAPPPKAESGTATLTYSPFLQALADLGASLRSPPPAAPNAKPPKKGKK